MIIIAHRGARSTHPENSISAIDAAINVGAKAIEIDVHEQDGQLWVIHDKWLNRTTDHNGLLSQFSSETLHQVKVSQNQYLPTLEQVLSTINGRCALNIELKGITNFSLLYRYLDSAVSTYQFTPEQLIISSFNHHWLHTIKQESSWLIGALSGSKGMDKALFASQLGAVSINLDIDVVDADYVDHAKQLGLSVFVYTANHQQDWHWLDKLGVTGIFCDCPQVAINEFPQPDSFVWTSQR